MNTEMIYMKNLPDKDTSEMLSAIKKNNAMLYDIIYDVLCRENADGIRKDVVLYLSEHADGFHDVQESSYVLFLLLENSKFSPEWYAWINEYMLSAVHIGIDDMGILLNKVIENNISLEELKSVLAGKDDLIQVYPLIENEDKEDLMDYSFTVPDTVSESDMMENKENITLEKDEDKQKNSIKKNKAEYPDILCDMLTVMSGVNHEKKGSVLDFQDDFNKIIAEFRTAITRLSSYSTEIIREWEKDKDEIERQRALYNIYQNIIRNQQSKIEHMQNEIDRLNIMRQEEEKKAQNRETLNKKITELQILATDIEQNRYSD